MEKIVYRKDKPTSEEHGLFEEKRFRKYMNVFSGVELVERNFGGSSSKGYTNIYHIEPAGVTLHYNCDEYYHTVSKDQHVIVLLTLFGSEDGIGEIERKILKDARSI